MASAVVNEVIPFSLLFPCHLFLVAILGMRSSGTADGSRPSVTTINYPDAIFARAMEKLLARFGYVHVVPAYTHSGRDIYIHVRVAPSV